MNRNSALVVPSLVRMQYRPDLNVEESYLYWLTKASRLDMIRGGGFSAYCHADIDTNDCLFYIGRICRHKGNQGCQMWRCIAWHQLHRPATFPDAFSATSVVKSSFSRYGASSSQVSSVMVSVSKPFMSSRKVGRDMTRYARAYLTTAPRDESSQRERGRTAFAVQSSS